MTQFNWSELSNLLQSNYTIEYGLTILTSALDQLKESGELSIEAVTKIMKELDLDPDTWELVSSYVTEYYNALDKAVMFVYNEDIH